MKGNTLEKKIQKLADLWLVGKMVNRIGIYGSKVAEGLSAFQRRSCILGSIVYSWNDMSALWKQTIKSYGHNISYYHNNDVMMGAVASQNTSLAIVYSTVYSDADQRKHQSSASLAFVRGIHRWPVISPHKGPETGNADDVPFDGVITFADITDCIAVVETSRELEITPPTPCFCLHVRGLGLGLHCPWRRVRAVG